MPRMHRGEVEVGLQLYPFLSSALDRIVG